MDDVASRDLICGQLPALKDNRAEIEKLQSVVQRETANGVPVTKYQIGSLRACTRPAPLCGL
jgi:hypothetical protein